MNTKEAVSQVIRTFVGINKRPLLVAIDGHGGSGKSLFTQALKQELNNHQIKAAVIPLDAFIITEPAHAWKALKDHPEVKSPYKINIPRLRNEVLEPLSAGKAVTYLFHQDWWDPSAKETRSVNPEGVIILEGCYSLSRELRGYYDYKIFLECPLDTCFQRASARDISLGGDPVTAPLLWKEIYFPAELEYMNNERPKQAADLVVNTKD